MTSFASNLCKCPHALIPKARKLSPIGQTMVDYQWLQWHPIEDVRFDGSTQGTTHGPFVKEYVESSWELVLGWLGFGIIGPNIVVPSLKVVNKSMCCVQHCFLTWSYVWTVV
jgi:hypothetical protein